MMMIRLSEKPHALPQMATLLQCLREVLKHFRNLSPSMKGCIIGISKLFSKGWSFYLQLMETSFFTIQRTQLTSFAILIFFRLKT